MDLLHQLFQAIRYEGDEQKGSYALQKDPSLAHRQWQGSEKYAKGSTALHYAVQANFMELTRQLVEYGADVNANTAHQLGTPLAWAADAGAVEAVQFLLAQGADARADLGGGETALHCAARGGMSEGHSDPAAYGRTAQMLIRHGADVNAPSPAGTPLALAIEHGNAVVEEVLRRYGATE